MTFDHLGLSADILRAVADEGYTEPTPIQDQAIPLVLAGRDVLAAAQTGTGKTAAFTLPDPGAPQGPGQHELLAGPPSGPGADGDADPRAGDADRRRASPPTVDTCPCASAVVYGGVPIEPQIKELRAGVEILVATPGRLMDHVGPADGQPVQVEILVLDEADRMLDMGFIPDIRKIVALLPARRQNLLFSGHVLRRDPAPRRRSSCATRRPSRSPPATPPPRAWSRSSTRSIATARRTS